MKGTLHQSEWSNLHQCNWRRNGDLMTNLPTSLLQPLAEWILLYLLETNIVSCHLCSINGTCAVHMPCRFHYEYFNKAPNSVQILWFKHADSYLSCGISSGVGIRVLSTNSPSRGSWDPSLRIDSCATCGSARVAGIVGSVATLHNGEISLIVKPTNGNQRSCKLLSGQLVVKLLPWDFKQQLAENLTDGSCLPLNCRWARWFGAWREKRVVKGKKGEISKRNTMNCRKLRCTEKIADIALTVGMYAQEKLEGKIPWRRKWIKKQETNNRQRHKVTTRRKDVQKTIDIYNVGDLQSMELWEALQGK